MTQQGHTGGPSVVQPQGPYPIDSADLPTSAAKVSRFIAPSGDASGATDTAAINAALALGNVNVVVGSVIGQTIAYINASLLMNQSGTTLTLLNCTLRLVDNANVPPIMSTAGVSNLAVVGLGNSILDHNGLNQTLQTPGYLNVSILFVNVAGFIIDNLQLLNAGGWGISPQSGCSNWIVSRIRARKTGTLTNSSVVTVYGTNSDWTISDISGASEDDCIALLTYTSAAATSGMQAYTETGGLITRGNINNVVGNWGITTGVPLRMLSGDAAGNAITRIRGDNIGNTTTSTPIVAFGPPSVYLSGMPNSGQLNDIKLSNLFTPATGGAASLITLDQVLGKLTIDAVHCGSQCGYVLGTINPQTGTVTFGKITIRGVRMLGTSGCNHPIQLPSNYTFSTTLACRDWDLSYAPSLLKNLCTASVPIDMKGIRIGILDGSGAGNLAGGPTIWSTLFQSTSPETGSIEDVQVASFIPGATTSGVRMRTVFGRGMPKLTSGDTVLPVGVLASHIVCDNTLDPTGGSSTHAAEYTGNGTAWVRAVDLGAFNPGLVSSAPLFAWYQAAQVPGTDGTAIGSVTDLSGNGNTLTQATGANKPLIKLAIINGQSVLRFNGTSQFLQSAAITALGQPLTLIVVMQFQAVPATGYVLDGGNPSTGGTRPILYKLPGGMSLNYGGANITNGTATAITTPYIWYAALASASELLWINNNEVTGASSPAGQLQGITLGAQYNATNFAQVDIAEVIIYSGLLSAADFTAVNSYLGTLYGIASPP